MSKGSGSIFYRARGFEQATVASDVQCLEPVTFTTTVPDGVIPFCCGPTRVTMRHRRETLPAP